MHTIKTYIFDDTTADHSAHWLQEGSPSQTAGDSNVRQVVRQADIASGSVMGRQKRIREELRDKLIQVSNFHGAGAQSCNLSAPLYFKGGKHAI